jgi:hypothetical protein
VANVCCKKAFIAHWGLPCKHFIRWLLQGGEDQGSDPKALRLDVVDKHWRLSRDGSNGLTDAERADFSAFFTPIRPLLLPLFIPLVANL